MTGLTFNIIRKERLPSTQKYLTELLQSGVYPEGTLVITSNQYSGIGQEKNQWHSSPGKNLTFSLLLKPTFLHPADQFMLTKMISLAVIHCLSKFTGIQEKLAIKWPNDIYCGNRKIAGILVSNAIMGNTLEHCIIGIGLNINESVFPEYCPNPTSLFLETGTELDTEGILEFLLESISTSYLALQNNTQLLDQGYLSYLYQYRQEKKYLFKGEEVAAKICGINEYGKLCLDIEGKGIEECDLKELVYL
ncbi:MAG: biotin--[acetyl-CoA-carboxylase] ligase [Bacteroidales bacterium]